MQLMVKELEDLSFQQPKVEYGRAPINIDQQSEL